MINKLYCGILAFLLTSVLFGCLNIKSSEKERKFKDYIPFQEVNTKIHITPIRFISGEIEEDRITIQIENISQELIVFPSDFGIKLLVYDASQWIELRDLVVNMYSIPGNDNPSEEDLQKTDIYLYPKDDVNLGKRLYTVVPELTGQKTPVNIRVLVIGEVYQNNNPTGEQVAAYEDFRYNPK